MSIFSIFRIVYESLFMAAVFVFPVYLFSSTIAGLPNRNKKAVDKAIEKGHVVTAKLIKTGPILFDVPGQTTRGPYQEGVYEYTYKRRRYKYRFISDSPPSQLTLYFLSNPRKATVGKALIDSETNWIRIYLIVAGLLLALNWP